jgi:transketolase
MRITYEDLLLEEAQADERIVVMTADNRSILRHVAAKLGPRFIDVGICEQTMIGAAAGLALRGRIPIVHALAPFLTLRPLEFIRTNLGVANLPVKLVGGIPGVLSDGNGPTHQSLEDVALMRGIPNMGVFCPADSEEWVAGMRAIIASPQPFYVRGNACSSAVEHREPFRVGQAEVLSVGTDIAILTYGYLVREAVRAKQLLEDRRRSVRLVNLRTLKPVDESAIIESVRGCAVTVTVEDHFRTGGLYSIVAEILLSRGLTGRVLAIALDERWFVPGRLEDVLEAEGFSGERLADTISASMS